jgi:hypothetical protein
VNPPARGRDLHVIADRCRVSGSGHACVHFSTTIAHADSREIHVILHDLWTILP